MYKALTAILTKFVKKNILFKYGFNISPMYRRTTGRVLYISEDFYKVNVTIPISYKNKNYVGSIFGGSMLSATDPIFMTQFMQILGDDFVVWDKAASIKFKRPAKENIFIEFLISPLEIEGVKKRIATEKEIDLIKEVHITNKDGSIVFAEVHKTIYIATKEYYKEKQKNRSTNTV